MSALEDLYYASERLQDEVCKIDYEDDMEEDCCDDKWNTLPATYQGCGQ